jgi:cytochrome c
MHKLLMLIACVLPVAMVGAEEGPGLGEAVSAEQLAAVDFTIMPDGAGLPVGSGDAVAGREVYNRNCLACHGENGTGGVNDRLAGGHGSLTAERPVKTIGSYWPYATTIFDYVRRAMPFQTPGSLSNDEIYAVTAFLLHINGIIAEDTTLDADSLPDVVMPNRDNFVWDYRPE